MYGTNTHSKLTNYKIGDIFFVESEYGYNKESAVGYVTKVTDDGIQIKWVPKPSFFLHQEMFNKQMVAESSYPGIWKYYPVKKNITEHLSEKSK